MKNLGMFVILSSSLLMADHGGFGGGFATGLVTSAVIGGALAPRQRDVVVVEQPRSNQPSQSSTDLDEILARQKELERKQRKLKRENEKLKEQLAQAQAKR